MASARRNDGRSTGRRRTTESNTYRFFVDPVVIRADAVEVVDPALLHQIVAVLRLQPGHEITLLDNSGSAYTVHIDHLDRRLLGGRILAREHVDAEPQLQLTVYQALLRAERFEWVLQKGTEIGISRFVPVAAERSAGEGAAVTSTKLERWSRIIREAAEQSRRGRLPDLAQPISFLTACEELAAGGSGILLWEGGGATTLRDIIKDTGIPHAFISGPEGGWSDDECRAAERSGLPLVTLGPRTLRAETAPLVAAASIMFAAGE